MNKEVEEKKDKVRKGLKISKLPKGATLVISMKVGDRYELVHIEQGD